MRVFAVSDVHIDCDANARSVAGLSTEDYQHAVLILAGDISDTRRLLEWGLIALAKRFKTVLFAASKQLMCIHEG